MNTQALEARLLNKLQVNSSLPSLQTSPAHSFTPASIDHPKVRSLEIELFATWKHPSNWAIPPDEKLQEWFATDFARRLSKSLDHRLSGECFCAFVAREADEYTSAYNVDDTPRTRDDFEQMMRRVSSTSVVSEVQWKLYQEAESCGHDHVDKRFIVQRSLSMWITHLAEKVNDTMPIADDTTLTEAVHKCDMRDWANLTPGREQLTSLEVRSARWSAPGSFYRPLPSRQGFQIHAFPLVQSLPTRNPTPAPHHLQDPSPQNGEAARQFVTGTQHALQQPELRGGSQSERRSWYRVLRN
jgi:hypothetical protein